MRSVSPSGPTRVFVALDTRKVRLHRFILGQPLTSKEDPRIRLTLLRKPPAGADKVDPRTELALGCYWVEMLWSLQITDHLAQA